MKRFAYSTAIAVAGLTLVCSRAARAQDPAVVNSNTVKVKLENEQVRVMEATLKPGEREKPHSHPGYVTYVLAGGKVRMHYPDGTQREATLSAGDVVYSEPTVHWAENIGPTEMRFVLVEVRK